MARSTTVLGIIILFGLGVFSDLLAQTLAPSPIHDVGLTVAAFRQDDATFRILPTDSKGCSENDVANVREFVSSREKADKEGLISKHPLIYAYMLLTETLACGGKYSKKQYCEQQSAYLTTLEMLYQGGGKPIVDKLPLPSHHLQNLINLRTRCAP